jgi:hypothetical protein
MNEADWESCTDPTEMLEFLRASGQPSDRKARLFAVSVCRHVWGLLTDERSRKAVIVAERHADGLASDEELGVACVAATALADALYHDDRHSPLDGAPAAAGWAADPVTSTAAVNAAHDARWAAEFDGDAQVFRAQAVLLRDIFGNPFWATPAIAARVRAHDDGLVVKLAQAAYDDRVLPAGTLDPAPLAVLADALEESGADAGLVAHLRDPGTHVRGCFALDVVLGRS